MFQGFKSKFPAASYLPVRLIEPYVDIDSLVQTLSGKFRPLREQDPVFLHIDTAAVGCVVIFASFFSGTPFNMNDEK